MKPNIARVPFKIFLSTVVAGIGLFGALLGFKAWKSLRQPIPQLEFPKQEIPDIPGSFYLKNVPPVDDIHLLDGEFKIVQRVNEVPDACMSTFESSFVTINGLHAKAGEVRFANPEESFNWSDAIQEGLPFRRLEFAGLSTSGCFNPLSEWWPALHFLSGCYRYREPQDYGWGIPESRQRPKRTSAIDTSTTV